eukprot:GGOE01036818.1.p1 GENE.GGOE01036818.1~~GGOE01036818.1.p1  ORF type:complete len:857 (-),score=181.53 GGOE01036818.1:122-2692(-)
MQPKYLLGVVLAVSLLLSFVPRKNFTTPSVQVVKANTTTSKGNDEHEALQQANKMILELQQEKEILDLNSTAKDSVIKLLRKEKERLTQRMESLKKTIEQKVKKGQKDLPALIALLGDVSPADLAVHVRPKVTGEKISTLQSEVESLQFLVDHGSQIANRINQELAQHRNSLTGKRRELDRLQNQPLSWDRVRNVHFAPYTCPGAAVPLPVQYHHSCFHDAEQRLQRLEHAWLTAYPVSFCYPRSVAEFYHQKFANVTRTIQMMEGLHSHWVNGHKEYGTANEGAYLQQYAKAQCVETRRKAGWDCLRHLEIMATGAIPVFRLHDTEPIDPLTMYHHPKECIGTFAKARSAPRLEVERLRSDLWQFFSRHLACDSELQFVMRAVDYDPCTEVPALYLDSYLARDIDYQSNSFFSGLRDVLGPNLDVWQEPHYLYSNWEGDQHTLYGNGLGYALAIDARLHSNGVPDHVVISRLKAKYYKLVVYGSITRSLPFWNEVSAALPPDRIWAVDGEDVPPGNEPFFRQGKHHQSIVFAREMRESLFSCPLPPPPPVWQPSCLSPSKLPLPTDPQCQCLRQAETRINMFVTSKPVYPISFCLTRPQLEEWDAIRRRRPKVEGHALYRRKSGGLNIERDALAASEFATLQPGPPWGSDLLIQMFGAGVLPLWDAGPTPRRFSLFHYPKECFRSYRDALHNASLRAALRSGTRTFVQNHLTCNSMAQFMMRSVNFNPCVTYSALFINETSSGDAALMAGMVLAGLQETMGVHLDVWNANAQPQPTGSGAQTPIPQRLKERHYALVVYGSFTRSSALLTEVRAALPPTRILAVVADASALQDLEAAGVTLFTREANIARTPARRT